MITDVSRSSLELSRVPLEYHLANSIGHPLYRGDVAGIESTGMLPKIFSRVDNPKTARSCIPFIHWDANKVGVRDQFEPVVAALNDFELMDAFRAMRHLIEGGDDKIVDLFIKWHTDCLPFSPFVSTTLSPKIAQLHASKWEKTTIYELNIAPNRIIFDAKNEGGTGDGGEAMIFGGIAPEEIVKIKAPNIPEYSELLDGHWLKDPRDFDLSDYRVKDPNNWVEFGV